MARIKWHEIGEKHYETGVRRGVLYPQAEGIYPSGVAWNGLTAVTESPSGAEPTPLYADDTKYLVLMSIEEFGATIEAFMYPDEFKASDGSAALAPGVYVGQQPRKPFGMAYRTVLGNDVEGEAFGYKLHLVYGAKASPSEKAFETINDTPSAITFSWSITTTPVEVPGHNPSASITIDSTQADPDELKALEDILYGTDGEGTTGKPPRLPLPEEIATLFPSFTEPAQG